MFFSSIKKAIFLSLAISCLHISAIERMSSEIQSRIEGININLDSAAQAFNQLNLNLDPSELIKIFDKGLAFFTSFLDLIADPTFEKSIHDNPQVVLAAHDAQRKVADILLNMDLFNAKLALATEDNPDFIPLLSELTKKWDDSFKAIAAKLPENSDIHDELYAQTPLLKQHHYHQSIQKEAVVSGLKELFAETE